MIVVHYAHRMPADYDLGALRRWLKDRGAVWDAVPELYFKAFLLREVGRFGATANNFSSLYLWQQDKAFRDWLVRGGYEVVTDIIGRARSRRSSRSTPSGAKRAKPASSTGTISPFRLMP